MPRDLEAITKRTEERHDHLRDTFNKLYKEAAKKLSKQGIKPDFDSVVAAAAKECRYAFSTAKRYLLSV